MQHHYCYSFFCKSNTLIHSRKLFTVIVKDNCIIYVVVVIYVYMYCFNAVQEINAIMMVKYLIAGQRFIRPKRIGRLHIICTTGFPTFSLLNLHVKFCSSFNCEKLRNNYFLFLCYIKLILYIILN